MNSTPDGAVPDLLGRDGAYIREHFFGADPRLRKMVEHMTDEQIEKLPRGGHDYRKVYAAFDAADQARRPADRDPGQDHQGLDDRGARGHATPPTR